MQLGNRNINLNISYMVLSENVILHVQQHIAWRQVQAIYTYVKAYL